MKISTKVEYGLIAIIDIAIHSKDNQSVNSVQISERHGISKKFLEQIMNALRTAKLVSALKGARGGYKLNRSSKDITLTEILNALDISILEKSISNFSIDSDIENILNNSVWSKINDSILNVTDNITLQNLVDIYNDTKSIEANMYYI